MTGQISVIFTDRINELSTTISSLLNSKYVDRVILSTFKDKLAIVDHEKGTLILNKRPANSGKDNRNEKIICCYNALRYVDTKYSLTLFQDIDNFDLLIDNLIEKFDSNKLYTTGINKEVPFCPNFTIFGTTKKVKDFWQCPLDETLSGDVIQENCYICSHYLKLYSTAAGDAILNPEKFLFDNAPDRLKMIDSSNKVMSKYFEVLGA